MPNRRGFSWVNDALGAELPAVVQDACREFARTFDAISNKVPSERAAYRIQVHRGSAYVCLVAMWGDGEGKKKLIPVLVDVDGDYVVDCLVPLTVRDFLSGPAA